MALSQLSDSFKLRTCRSQNKLHQVHCSVLENCKSLNPLEKHWCLRRKVRFADFFPPFHCMPAVDATGLGTRYKVSVIAKGSI